MPALWKGSTPVTALFKGATPVSALYLGSTLVWSASAMLDNFMRANSVGLGANWDDLSSTSPFLLSVVNNMCKMNIPGGTTTGVQETSYQRYNVAQHTADPGYIEIKAGTRGDGSQISQAFRRANNSGSTLTNGVGIQLKSSTISIVTRIASVDAVRQACGSYQSGDTIRLTQVGTGASAVHTMTKNGKVVGAWPDTGALVPSGSSNRSMVVRGDGESIVFFFVFSSISYSSAIDTINCA